MKRSWRELRRRFWRAAFVWLSIIAALAIGPTIAQAAEPLKIGFSMPLTGGLASGGKAALVTIQMWAATSMPRAVCSAARYSSSSTMTSRIRRRCPAFTPSCSTSTKSI